MVAFTQKDFQLHKNDTGSTKVQIFNLTERILDLTNHFNEHKKDNHSKVGLKKMVSRRNRLLKYLKSTQLTEYLELLSQLNLRK